MAESNSEVLREEAKLIFGGLFNQEAAKNQDRALEQVVALEKEAMEVARDMKERMPAVVAEMNTNFWKELAGTNEITEEQKKDLKELYGVHVVKNLEEIPKALYGNLKKGQGILFNGMMNERTIDALDGIIEFKNKIDERYPGLSDVMIKLVSFALTAAVVTVSPAAGVALKSSGVMEMAQDFLKTENLKETRKNLHDGLKKIEEDEKLKEIKARADKTTEVAEKTGVVASVLNRVGLSDRALNAIAEDVTKVPAYKDFVEGMTKYADAVIPASQEQITENMKAVKGQMIEELKKNGVPEAEVAKIEAKIDERFKEVEKVLAGSLDPEKSFMEKVMVQQEGAKKLLEVSGELVSDAAKLVPEQKDIEKAVMGAVAAEVVKKVSGPVEDLQKGIKDPAIKEMVQKELGKTVRADIAIERTEKAIDKAQGKSADKGR